MNALKKYARRVALKATKTFAQTLAAVLTANGAGLVDANWTGALSAAGMAALLSVLTNIGDTTNDAPDPAAPTEY